MKRTAIIVLCLIAQWSFALRFGATPVVDIPMGGNGKTSKSENKADEKKKTKEKTKEKTKTKTKQKEKTKTKQNEKKSEKKSKGEKTVDKPSSSADDSKEKDAHVLKIDETKFYTTEEEAIKALKTQAEYMYRVLTKDYTSPIDVVGKNGQEQAELCAYIVQRKGKYYITNIVQLSAEGGSTPVNFAEGDIIIGFHTGIHDGSLSNIDYDGLKDFNADPKAKELKVIMESKIAYDVAQGRTFKMGEDGVLFEQNPDGGFVSRLKEQQADCSIVRRETGKTGYDITKEYLDGGASGGHDAACDPAIKTIESVQAKTVATAEANATATFGNKAANADAARVKRNVFGGNSQ